MVDRPRLDSMFGNLRAYALVLQHLAQVSRSEFLGNPDKIGNAKYHFVIAIECCLDIAHHIIASERLRVPVDNADSFVVLIEGGFCDEELLEPLKSMARFRNRLVHIYWEVQDDLVYEYLVESLPDLQRFATAVATRLISK